MKKKIILVLGDPNSINSEIIFKSLKKIKNNLKNRIYLIANFDLIKKQFKILNYRIKLVKVKDLKQKPSQPGLKIIDVNLSFKNPFNVSLSNSSKFVLRSLDTAHKLALSKDVSGIINCKSKNSGKSLPNQTPNSVEICQDTNNVMPEPKR